MATIGLDKLFYSKITEGENGDETYAASGPRKQTANTAISGCTA